MREIEGGAFQGMRNLVYLYLSDNDLTSLEPKAFAGVPKLTYLHLEGNRLTQFPGDGQIKLLRISFASILKKREASPT